MQGFKLLDTELSGVDRKSIAVSVYDALPPVIWIGVIPVPVSLIKIRFSRDDFESLVEQVYQETHEFLLQNETYLTAQVDAFVNADKPK